MTSIRQIEAYRRNAEKSTGPRTDTGKQRSGLNALRHGLTAETVVLPFEDPDDYQAFEEAVLSGFDPETAVERELMLRVAALLWRMRRAASVETVLFQLAGDAVPTSGSGSDNGPPANQPLYLNPLNGNLNARAPSTPGNLAQSDNPRTAIARNFLNLVNGDDALERTTRYELALWRQLRQALFMLDVAAGRRALRQHYRGSRWSHNFPGSSRDERR